jgi:hypothetical protein
MTDSSRCEREEKEDRLKEDKDKNMSLVEDSEGFNIRFCGVSHHIPGAHNGDTSDPSLIAIKALARSVPGLVQRVGDLADRLNIYEERDRLLKDILGMQMNILEDKKTNESVNYITDSLKDICKKSGNTENTINKVTTRLQDISTNVGIVADWGPKYGQPSPKPSLAKQISRDIQQAAKGADMVLFAPDVVHCYIRSSNIFGQDDLNELNRMRIFSIENYGSNMDELFEKICYCEDVTADKVSLAILWFQPEPVSGLPDTTKKVYWEMTVKRWIEAVTGLLDVVRRKFNKAFIVLSPIDHKEMKERTAIRGLLSQEIEKFELEKEGFIVEILDSIKVQTTDGAELMNRGKDDMVIMMDSLPFSNKMTNEDGGGISAFGAMRIFIKVVEALRQGLPMNICLRCGANCKMDECVMPVKESSQEQFTVVKKKILPSTQRK